MNTIIRVLATATVALAAGWVGPTDTAAQVDVQAMARGAQTYGQQCARCHVSRSSTERSDRDWTTIMKHMRARANLTRAQAQDVATFLQATNGQESVPREADQADGGGAPIVVGAPEGAWVRLGEYLRRRGKGREQAVRPRRARG